MMKLHTQNFGGNLHEAATTINRWGWAEYLIHLESVSGHSTIAVFKMPAGKVHEIRASTASYVADPHHDDYAGPADPWAADYRLNTVLATVDHAIETPPAKAEQTPVAQGEEKPKPARRKAADKLKDASASEQPAEQAEKQVEQQTSTVSETGVNMNAAETAMKSDLPDWAK